LGNPLQGIKHSTINLLPKGPRSPQNIGSSDVSNVEEMLARLIAGDDKLRELLVKTTQCYIRDKYLSCKEETMRTDEKSLTGS